MRINWLYLAIRSVRDSDPVLIWPAFVATAITFFYSVVVGWCIFYLIQMVIEPLPRSSRRCRLPGCSRD